MGNRKKKEMRTGYQYVDKLKLLKYVHQGENTIYFNSRSYFIKICGKIATCICSGVLGICFFQGGGGLNPLRTRLCMYHHWHCFMYFMVMTPCNDSIELVSKLLFARVFSTLMYMYNAEVLCHLIFCEHRAPLPLTPAYFLSDGSCSP